MVAALAAVVAFFFPRQLRACVARCAVLGGGRHTWLHAAKMMVGYLVLVRTCATSTSSPTTARASSASETGRISTCLKRLRSIPRITSTQSSGAVASCAGEARAADDDLGAGNLLLEEKPLQVEAVPRDIAHGGEAPLEQLLGLVYRAHGFQAHRLGHDADLLIVDFCAAA